MKPFNAILLPVATGAGAVAIVVGWMAWMQERMPFNDEGRFFDGLTVHHEQAVLVYAVITVFSAVISIACFWLATRRTQRDRH